ncbi:unnamed protein product [Arabis nemorensis]|uniref:Uncharacterized protein n=1 Tax=Arabis nemorensis TaxID=586526 RepID=A0A565B0W5_9BRAS|nr:unnamed protein product [Arabis nemorensis]
MDEDIVQSQRPRLLSGSLTPSAGPLSLNVIASIHSVMVKSPASISPRPEPPDLILPKPQELSPVPEPPDPPPAPTS